MHRLTAGGATQEVAPCLLVAKVAKVGMGWQSMAAGAMPRLT